MQNEKPRTWHNRIYALSYTMFGATPQKPADDWAYWSTVTGTMAYCVFAIAIFLTLNIATLPFGVLAEPVWRAKQRFRILRFHDIPLLPFSAGIALAYATWRTWILRGPASAIGPWLFVAALGLLFFGAGIARNRLRSRRGS